MCDTTRFFQILPQVLDDEKDELCAPSTHEEVVETLQNMRQQTAPGADGILTGFYYTFFHVNGKRIVRMLNDLINHKTKPLTVTKGTISWLNPTVIRLMSMRGGQLLY